MSRITCSQGERLRRIRGTARSRQLAAGDCLWVAGADSAQRLRFEPLPQPTTAEIERMATSIAERVTRHVARVWETEGSGYLDPRLAALVEAFFFSRIPPVATRSSEVQRGTEGEEEGATLRGKTQCAVVTQIV